MRNVMCKNSTKPVQLGRDLYMKRMILLKYLKI